MTTEAEEFKRQEERFKEISSAITQKYYLKQGSWGYGIEAADKEYIAGIWKNEMVMQVYPSFLLLGSAQYAKTEHEALRALNDRLGLALQGKTNGN